MNIQEDSELDKREKKNKKKPIQNFKWSTSPKKKHKNAMIQPKHMKKLFNPDTPFIEEDEEDVENKQEKLSSSPYCDQCDEGTTIAVACCDECNQKLCKLHADSHKLTRTTKTHAIKAVPKIAPHYCEQCDEGKSIATGQCSTCNQYLCQIHVKAHQVTKSTKTHTIEHLNLDQ